MKLRHILTVLVALTACHGGQVMPKAHGSTARPGVVAPAASLPGLLPVEAEAMRAGGVEPGRLHCNGRQSWNAKARTEAKAATSEMLGLLQELGGSIPEDKFDAARKAVTDVVFWRIVRTTIVDGDQNNLGAVPVRGLLTRAGRPVLLFRAGFTAHPDQPGACFRSLVEQADVRHVVNLYAGPMPTADLEAGERSTVKSVGGTYVTARDAAGDQRNWREDLRESEAARREAMAAVAAIVNDLLAPNGKQPTGNLMVHCGGGMHRTGMVVGVIERCINGADSAHVEATYKHHVAWRSAQDPGGFEQANLDFIHSFDCRLLHPAKPPAK